MTDKAEENNRPQPQFRRFKMDMLRNDPRVIPHEIIHRFLRAADQKQQGRAKKRIPASGFFLFFFCNKVKYFPVSYYDKIVSAVIMFSHG